MNAELFNKSKFEKRVGPRVRRGMLISVRDVSSNPLETASTSRATYIQEVEGGGRRHP